MMDRMLQPVRFGIPHLFDRTTLLRQISIFSIFSVVYDLLAATHKLNDKNFMVNDLIDTICRFSGKKCTNFLKC